jgi:hypothetical protein
MQKHVLVLTTSAFVVTGGALGADAQQAGDPMMQQQPQAISNGRS